MMDITSEPGFDACFVHIETGRHKTVGPFRTEDAAAAFGDDYAVPGLPFIGVSDHCNPTHFRRQSEAATVNTTTGTSRRWAAVINRWDLGRLHGFATDANGASWFVSRDQLPDGWKSLPPGTQITFAGSPHPAPGQKYPRAYTVRLADTDNT